MIKIKFCSHRTPTCGTLTNISFTLTTHLPRTTPLWLHMVCAQFIVWNQHGENSEGDLTVPVVLYNITSCIYFMLYIHTYTADAIATGKNFTVTFWNIYNRAIIYH